VRPRLLSISVSRPRPVDKKCIKRPCATSNKVEGGPPSDTGMDMATSQTSEVIQHLRRMLLPRDGAGRTDGQLLEDYLNRRDEAALTALVRRHGPMVWGVCRRVLRGYHDAEDAFQATFLVLVRKAASIASRELLANWLYGVAHQTALNARAMVARRKERERRVAEMPEPAIAEQDLWGDLQPLLDEELSRLPNKYRAVIELCDLEGKTRQEAARQLSLPEGTVAGQLARARVMLAKRLAQRGVALSGGALGVVLAQHGASAALPPSLMSSTINAASVYAAGQAAAAGVISAEVAALAEGVLKAMLVSKLKIATAVLLVVLACVGGGTAVFLPVAARRQPTATEKQDEKQPAAKKTEDAFPGEWVLADGSPDAGSDVMRTHSRQLQIPVLVEPARRGKIKELQLFASADRGETWQQVANLRPDGDAFRFEAPREGIYWFNMRVVNSDGTKEPSDVSSVPPALKVDVGAGEPKFRKDKDQAVHEPKGEVEVLRQQLERIQKRLSEIEQAKQK
jgi:RNA polymerase sigma factor (sigma-70 family)